MLGTDLAEAEKNGSFGQWGWLEGFSVQTWVAQEALSPQQNHSPQPSSAVTCPTQSVLLALRETLACRSQCPAIFAAHFYKAGGLGCHPPCQHCFSLLQCSDNVTLGPVLQGQ